MRNAKLNLLATIGIMVAMGTVSFKAAEKAAQTDYYFEVDSNGNVGSLLGTSIGSLGPDCLDGPYAVCAIRLDEAHVDGTNTPIDIEKLEDLITLSEDDYDVYTKHTL